MSAEDYNGEPSPSVNPTVEDHHLDSLARGLANGSISRRKAIKFIAATTLGGILGLSGIGTASAKNKTCAQWCAAVFGANTPAAGRCTSDAAHGKGLCSSSSCGPATLPSSVCCTRNSSNNCTSYSGASCPCDSGRCLTCDSSTGTCVGCTSGQTCVNGSCCVNANVCGSTCLAAPCDSSQCLRCDPSTGTCVGCPSGETCLNGSCCPNDQVCGSTCGCPPGQTCVKGSCCANADVCGTTCCTSGETCVNGSCCPIDQVCGTGTSVTCCQTGQTTCVDGTCCPNAQVCSTGTSVTCCPEGRVCGESGECQCPIGTTLCNGNCVDPTCSSNHKFDPSTCMCVACTSNDGICRADSECCSNICNTFGILEGHATCGTCRSDGNLCSAGDDDCCSGKCVNGRCCGNIGDFCDADIKCCSGNCDTRKCAPPCVSDGGSCNNDDDCCHSAICPGGRCCRPMYDFCSSNAQCCTGSCCLSSDGGSGFCCL
jgi:hypothetical protein